MKSPSLSFRSCLAVHFTFTAVDRQFVCSGHGPEIPVCRELHRWHDSVFRVQPLTGQLSEISGSPFSGGYAIQGLALTPDNKFLYSAGGA